MTCPVRNFYLFQNPFLSTTTTWIFSFCPHIENIRVVVSHLVRILTCPLPALPTLQMHYGWSKWLQLSFGFPCQEWGWALTQSCYRHGFVVRRFQRLPGVGNGQWAMGNGHPLTFSQLTTSWFSSMEFCVLAPPSAPGGAMWLVPG